MFKNERQENIMTILKKNGRIVASELPSILNVSIDTVRRDLDQLAEEGYLLRTHGGATIKSTVSSTFEERIKQSLEGKEEISSKVINLLKPNQTIIIDGGTTMIEIVAQIPIDFSARIVTHNQKAISLLSNHTNIELIIIGGKYNHKAHVTFGADVVSHYQSIRADICLLGASGLNSDDGIGAMYYEEMLVREAIIKASNQVIVPLTKDKLGITSPFIVSPADSITYLVTENVAEENILQPFIEKGITIVN